jgi:hypothetical protein
MEKCECIQNCNKKWYGREILEKLDACVGVILRWVFIFMLMLRRTSGPNKEKVT